MAVYYPPVKTPPEIAKIRGVEPYTQINSPATHSAFSSSVELMLFIKKLRELSAGKPIGFKLCIGQRRDFIILCKAMLETGIKPDFYYCRWWRGWYRCRAIRT